MDRDTDVLVVGGGATGVGIARDMAMRGLTVTLCEREGLASGTTGRSHGVLHSGARYAESDPDGARECIAENRIVKDIAGECVRDSGGYFVQLEGDSSSYFDEKLEACREEEIDAEELSGEAALSSVPALSTRTERVIQVPDAVIYPSRLVAATAKSASEHGARILPNAPVTDLLLDGERVVGATVEHEAVENIHAEHVVNATGAWAGRLADYADIKVEMRPTKGVMVAVSSPEIEPVLNRCRPPADGDIVVPHEGQVILGTTSVEVESPDSYPTENQEIERMITECAAMVPALGEKKPSRAYWGVRPLYAPDEDERGDARGISRGFFLLDHAARDGMDGFTSIVGGKLTTYRRMAEAVADHVCEKLDVEDQCRTADEALPGHDDPDALDGFVGEFEVDSPADVDVTDA